MTDLPSHLYHYTSIENLALILSNKTIRFNRLDLLNDLQEGVTCDLPGIRSHIFASCWTRSADENLPLWKWYGGDLKGCRIRLPANPFNGELVSVDPLNGTAKTRIKLNRPVQYQPAFFRGEECDIHEILGPTELKYEDTQALAPSVVTDTGDGAKFDARNIGLAKRKHWEFEKEWRYRIHVAPEGRESGYSKSEDGDLTSFLEIQLNPPIGESIDVPITKEALEDLEILMAPNAGAAEFAIATKFAPSSTTIEKSGVGIRETSHTDN